MTGQSITFDFLTTGVDRTAGGFRKVADNTTLAARGAKVLSNVIETLGQKEDRTAAESAILAKALRQTGEAEDRVAARAVLADAAIRRLDDAMQDSSKNAGSLGKALGGLKLNPGLLGPALALAPAMATLGGVAAGAAAGLGGAFVAAAGGLAAFGAVAKPVLTDAKKASDAVEKAQSNYNAAIASGVPQAKAYKAEQIAIAKAYAGLSPAQIALSKQIGAMAKAWDAVKAAQTPVVAGALQPWLKSVTDLTGKLGPVIAKIAPVIKGLGGQFDQLINSSAFTQFRDFIGSTGAAAVSAGGSTIIDLVKSFMILLPKFDPLIREAVGWISRLGPAVLTWASSKKAADDITKFMQWFSKNGPVVGGLLKNIGGALAALAPGLTSGATLELKIISDFLGWVAKLPPSIAKPLAEVAGAALILSKMGGGKVISFLVTGTLGGIFGKGGAAAAGGAAEAGGAASLWSKLTPGARLAGGVLAMTLIVDAVLKSTPSGPGGKNWFDNPFGMPGPGDKASQNNWLTSWSPYLNTFKKNFAGMTRFFTGTWSTATSDAGAKADALRTKNLTPLLDEVGKVSGGVQGLAGTIRNTLLIQMRAAGARSDDLRTRNLTPLRGEVGRVSGGIQGLSRYMHPGLTGAMTAGGQHADTFRTRNLGPLRGELARDSGGVQGLQGLINGLHGKTVHVNFVGSGSGSIAFKESIPGVTTGPSSQGLLGFHAAGGRVGGHGGPRADNQLIAVSSGEFVHQVSAVNKYGVPAMEAVNAGRAVIGYAAGGPVNVTGAVGPNGMFTAGQPYMANTEAAFGRAVEGAFATAAIAKFKKDAAAALVKAGQPFGPLGDSGARSGSAALAQAFARSIMWQYHWGPEQWPPWLYLGNQESGWNAYAVNPSSGAYGIGQSLGHGHPYNLGDYKTQVIWMANYIRGRYGTPAAAWAHERAFNWYSGGGLVPGFASGGTVAGQGAAYLKAWQTRHGGGFGAAWGPVVVNEQIARMAAAQHRAAVLAKAAGLTPGQHRFWAATAADEARRLGTLHKELVTERAWRGQLGASDATLAAEIAAAGSIPSLRRNVLGWRAQLARQKATIAGISAMLGYSDAHIAADVAAGKLGPGGTPLPGITHTYGGVTDVIEAFLAAHASPFARGGLVMDSGGWLKPGWNPPSFNGTGRPEHLVPARSGGGDVHLHLTVNAPVGSQRQLEDWFVMTANKTAHQGRLTQAVRAAGR
jgi:hypothetical protein